ncbi:hypothetical protein BGZ98_003952, partial [Dissophora globulifera]
DGDLEAVKKFVEEQGISIDAQDENGYSALHAAASYGHEELIKYLLDKGANVNIQDPDGDSPLFVCETVDVAKLLVDAGIDVTHVNDNELTAAENAEEEEWYEVAHYLRELTGVPHPDNGDNDEDADMAHLLAEDKEEDEETDAAIDSFKGRIEAIMRATEADGVSRDDELKAVVSEMLAAVGPERAAALSKDLQALDS